jgi:hypothetical protein
MCTHSNKSLSNILFGFRVLDSIPGLWQPEIQDSSFGGVTIWNFNGQNKTSAYFGQQ